MRPEHAGRTSRERLDVITLLYTLSNLVSITITRHLGRIMDSHVHQVQGFVSHFPGSSRLRPWWEWDIVATEEEVTRNRIRSTCRIPSWVAPRL
jgi:hypothetical protein